MQRINEIFKLAKIKADDAADEQQAMNEKGDQIIDDVNTTLAALRGPEKEAFIKVFNEHMHFLMKLELMKIYLV